MSLNRLRLGLDRWSRVAACVGALSASVVACSDDEDVGGKPDGDAGAGGSSAGGRLASGGAATTGGASSGGASSGGTSSGGAAAGGAAAGGTDGTDGGPATGGTDGGTDGGDPEGGGIEGGDGSVGCTVTPGAWSAPEWAANTAAPTALRAQLGALVGSALMQGAEAGTATVDELSDMVSVYEGGTPSLSSATTTYFDGVVRDAFGEFLQAVAAGTQDLVDADGFWTPGANGGIWGTTPRAFNEGGIELRQIIDKGLFGAATFYNHALGLTAGEITPATIDAIAASLGTNAGLNPGRNNAADVANQNHGAANYVYQMRMYATLTAHLTEAKAYAADEACVAERDDSIRAIFQTWEQAMFARFVFYANRAVTKVAGTTSDDDLASALHDLGEGLGLVMAFHGMPTPASGPMSGGGKRATDAQIAAILAAMGVSATGALSAATTGTFVEDASGFQTAVAAAEAVITTVWELTPGDLAGYRAPTDG